jgi:hypothetical protein
LLWHGSQRSLSVNVWFSARKLNAMTDPAEAFSDDGEKTSSPASPTLTVVVGRDADAVPLDCVTCVAFQPRSEVVFQGPRNVGELAVAVACDAAKSRFEVTCREGGVTHVVAASTTVLKYASRK